MINPIRIILISGIIDITITVSDTNNIGVTEICAGWVRLSVQLWIDKDTRWRNKCQEFLAKNLLCGGFTRSAPLPASKPGKPSKAIKARLSQLWTLPTSVTDLHCSSKTWNTTSKQSKHKWKQWKVKNIRSQDLWSAFQPSPAAQSTVKTPNCHCSLLSENY